MLHENGKKSWSTIESGFQAWNNRSPTCYTLECKIMLMCSICHTFFKGYMSSNFLLFSTSTIKDPSFFKTFKTSIFHSLKAKRIKRSRSGASLLRIQHFLHEAITLSHDAFPYFLHRTNKKKLQACWTAPRGGSLHDGSSIWKTCSTTILLLFTFIKIIHI